MNAVKNIIKLAQKHLVGMGSFNVGVQATNTFNSTFVKSWLYFKETEEERKLSQARNEMKGE